MKKNIIIILTTALITTLILVGINMALKKSEQITPNQEVKKEKKHNETPQTNQNEIPPTSSPSQPQTPEQSEKEYSFSNIYGDNTKNIKIKATKLLSLSGFAGAKNHVFYLDKNNDLYYLELTNLTTKNVAKNINDIILTDEGIDAIYHNNYTELIDNDYVDYERR